MKSLLENVYFLVPLVLDVSIFYRFRSEQICSLVVFGFQGTDLAVFLPLTIRCADSQTFGLFRHVLRTMF